MRKEELTLISSDDFVHAVFTEFGDALGVLELRRVCLQLADGACHFDAAARLANGVHVRETKIVEFLDVVDHLVLSVHVVERRVGYDGHDVIDGGTLCHLDELLDDLQWYNDAIGTLRMPL